MAPNLTLLHSGLISVCVDAHIFLDESISQNDVRATPCTTTAAPSQWAAAFDCDMCTMTTNFRPEPTLRSLSVIFGLITTHLTLANEVLFVQKQLVGAVNSQFYSINLLLPLSTSSSSSFQFKCIRHLKYFCRHAASVFVCMCSLTPSIRSIYEFERRKKQTTSTLN